MEPGTDFGPVSATGRGDGREGVDLSTCTSGQWQGVSGHREISDSLGAGFYFATPYHSWERGLNEHTNGLVREYFPRGTDFRMVTEAQVRAVEDRINHRPRKVLGYHTPAEVFAKALVPP